MNTEASPRPWLCMCGSDVNAVFAANGALVAMVEKAADAALIVAAVNERDRLRDIVKRMAKIIGEAPIDWFGASFVDTQVLLTEARSAIGEDAK